MQCILREKLMAQAIKLAVVSNIYQSESYRFVDAYIQWLNETAIELANLRAPMSVLLQAEKSKLIAVIDGYVPDFIQNSKSIRKSQRAVAAQSLEKMSQEIHSKVKDLDLNFEQLHEKLSHAVAILASKDQELYSRIAASQVTPESIWKTLSSVPETNPMYNYFCAKLASSDRNYLLSNIIEHIRANIQVDDQDSVNAKASTQPLESELHSLLLPLEYLKIENFEELLNQTKTPRDRKRLRKGKNISKQGLLALAKCADLMRIPNMGLPNAYVLFSSGIDSISELRGRNPNNLMIKVNNLISQRKFEITQLQLADVKEWVEAARKLDKLLTF